MDVNGQIDLATAAPFRIGPLTIEPALRQVSTRSTAAETLEPRVMQVLVALARADGAIISRDTLVQQCWEGRIVGDDSINRVISRLRRLSDERGDGSFRIETISRVGYRLIGAVLPVLPAGAQTSSIVPKVAAVPATVRNRSWIIAALIAVFAIAAGVAWRAHRLATNDARPVVEVEPFAVTAPGIAPGLAAEVRAETADFLANERFYAVAVAPLSAGARAGLAHPWHACAGR